MSVVMYVQYRNGEECSVPVAPTGVFARTWEKPALELGLELVPMMFHSLRLYERQAALDLLNELATLKDYLQNEPEIEFPRNWGVDKILERMAGVADGLQGSADNWDEVEYILF